MGFKCGIVGLPNVGKSTLFNALTNARIEAANYPFCTIKPHVGVATVSDSRLRALGELVKPQKVVPAVVEFVDIAGLVKGAANGEGLGNQFLANVRETDAIIHVVRCFEDEDVVHVHDRVNPNEDIEIVNYELILSDIAVLEKNRDRMLRLANVGDKEARSRSDALRRAIRHLEQGLWLRTLAPDDDARAALGPLHPLTMKPLMYLANVADENRCKNGHRRAVKAHSQRDGATMVSIAVRLEAEISELPQVERSEYLRALGLEESGLDKVSRAGYDMLGLKTFFTVGEKEVRAWTISGNSTVLEAAGKIHSDFERGFIRAEVISFSDYLSCQGEGGAREKGVLRVEGKDYIVADGDVIRFLFNR